MDFYAVFFVQNYPSFQPSISCPTLQQIAAIIMESIIDPAIIRGIILTRKYFLFAVQQ